MELRKIVLEVQKDIFSKTKKEFVKETSFIFLRIKK